MKGPLSTIWILTLGIFAAQIAAANTTSGASKPDKEQEAVFEDGEAVFRREVLRRMNFPASDYLAGEVDSLTVCFTVDSRGQLKNFSAERTNKEAYACQILDLLALAPDWKPALRKGKPKESLVTMEFNVRLENTVEEGARPVLRAIDETAYRKADVMPLFQDGGPEAFVTWAKRHWPDGGENGVYLVSFVIERDGSASTIRVSNCRREQDTADFEQWLCGMPRWTPAVLQGEAVRFRVVMLVDLSREGSAETALLEEGTYCRMFAMPSFQGGNLQVFRNWVVSNFQYPRDVLLEHVNGRVRVKFVVEADGTVSSVEVVETPDWRLSLAVMECLYRAPRWMPGLVGIYPVRTKFTLPVDFKFF